MARSEALNQQFIKDRFPFTVYSAEINPNTCDFLINLKNYRGQSLELYSDDIWQIITPTALYSSDFYGSDIANPNVASYINDLKVACHHLVGSQIAEICGYENLYDNTFIFDNGFIVRFKTTGDEYGSSMGNSVQWTFGPHTRGISNSFPYQMREQHLPLDLTTSSLNPFDGVLDVSDPALVAAVGSTVVEVRCPANKEPLVAAYALEIVLENGAKIMVENPWSVSCTRGVWASQHFVEDIYDREFSQMYGMLKGRCLVGFTGPDDLVQPSLLFEGGVRVDQFVGSTVGGAYPVTGGWSVTSRAGHFMSMLQ